ADPGASLQARPALCMNETCHDEVGEWLHRDKIRVRFQQGLVRTELRFLNQRGGFQFRNPIFAREAISALGQDAEDRPAGKIFAGELANRRAGLSQRRRHRQGLATGGAPGPLLWSETAGGGSSSEPSWRPPSSAMSLTPLEAAPPGDRPVKVATSMPKGPPRKKPTTGPTIRPVARHCRSTASVARNMAAR